MACLVRLEMILNEFMILIFSYGLFDAFLSPNCPPAHVGLGDFQRPSLNTRCRFLGEIWGTWSEGSAVWRAPVCRRSQRWGTGPNHPRRRTLTNRNRDWCRLAGRICNEGNGTARSWCLLHRYTRKWCKMCLKKRERQSSDYFSSIDICKSFCRGREFLSNLTAVTHSKWVPQRVWVKTLRTINQKILFFWHHSV